MAHSAFHGGISQPFVLGRKRGKVCVGNPLRILHTVGGLLRDPSAWTLQTLLGKYAASFLELIKLPGKREREKGRERGQRNERGMRDSTSGSTFFAYCQGLSTRHPETEVIGDTPTRAARLKAMCHGYLIKKRREIRSPCVDAISPRDSLAQGKRSSIESRHPEFDFWQPRSGVISHPANEKPNYSKTRTAPLRVSPGFLKPSRVALDTQKQRSRTEPFRVVSRRENAAVSRADACRIVARRLNAPSHRKP